MLSDAGKAGNYYQNINIFGLLCEEMLHPNKESQRAGKQSALHQPPVVCVNPPHRNSFTRESQVMDFKLKGNANVFGPNPQR